MVPRKLLCVWALVAPTVAWVLPGAVTPGVKSGRARVRHALTLQAQGMVSQAGSREGLHGTGSRFLPIVQIQQAEIMPRTVPVAGALAELTEEGVAACAQTDPAERGMWQYDFTDPDGPQMGTVALPGGEQVYGMDDPVAIVCTNTALGLELPASEEAELLAVVDRANQEFEIGKFFLWKGPEGKLDVRWYRAPPGDCKCLGRVVQVMVPFLSSMEKKSTGFQEVDEDF